LGLKKEEITEEEKPVGQAKRPPPPLLSSSSESDAVIVTNIYIHKREAFHDVPFHVFEDIFSPYRNESLSGMVCFLTVWKV